MAIPARQIGWGTEENLLWEVSKQLERLTQVSYNSNGTSGTSGTAGTSGTSVPTVGAITDLAAPIGVVAYDCSSSRVFVHFGVDALANWTANLTNFTLAAGESTTVSITASNADIAGHTYSIIGFQVNGVPQIWTKSWTNGVRNSFMTFTFTIVNTVSGLVAYGQRQTSVGA